MLKDQPHRTTERPNLEVPAMRRFSKFLILVGTMAVLVLPINTAAAATTTVTYDIAGIASTATFPKISFTGVASSESRTEFGVWNAAFSTDLGAVFDGTFTFKSRVHTLKDSIVGGTFGAPFGSPGTGTCAKTTIPVHGALASGGFFDVTLTRYGSLKSGSCVVYLSTVRGKATLAFPS
jgi:hypothetical protein